MTVRVLAGALAREMVAMRRWLDRNRSEPTRFDCKQNGRQIVLSVEFTTDAAAEAFAQCFNGEETYHKEGHWEQREPEGTGR